MIHRRIKVNVGVAIFTVVEDDFERIMSIRKFLLRLDF